METTNPGLHTQRAALQKEDRLLTKMKEFVACLIRHGERFQTEGKSEKPDVRENTWK